MRPPASARARRVGKQIDRLGQWMLPLGVGALIGYMAADRGVRLLPTMLELLSAWGLLALVMMGIGRFLRGKAFKDTPDGRTVRRRVVAVIVLGLMALGGRLGVWFTRLPTEMSTLTPEAFETAYDADVQRYAQHAAGMERLLTRIDVEEMQLTDDAPLTPDEEARLLDAFHALWDYSVDLDQLRAWWEGWYRYDPARGERSYHVRSFLLTYAAELALYEKTARFSQMVMSNEDAVRFLDAPHPAEGLPAGSFSRMRQNLLGTRDQARVLAGEQYLGMLSIAFDGRRAARQAGADWLWRAVEGHLHTISAVTPIDRAAVTLRADTQLLKRGVKRVWFPIQKETAEAMGDLRVRRVGWYLIDDALAEQILPALQPGDVMLSRKNWYLSNVGLPGFWPHGLIYLGTPEELVAWGDTPEIRAWVTEEMGADVGLEGLLASRHPGAWARYVAGEADAPFRVVEAISEGVVFNTIGHAAGDYLAALRPRLDRVARAQAITHAFGEVGKPYDFDFDFATDHALVCTELVWRSYRPAEGKAGLDIPVIQVAGRRTLPANEIARLYAEQVGSPDALFDFVAFIDASERTRVASVADEPTFRGTHARSRWDVATQ